MTRLRPTQIRVVALSAVAIGLVVLPIAAAQAHPAHPASTQSATATGSPSLTGLRPSQLTDSLLTQLSQLSSSGDGSGAPVAAAGGSPQPAGAATPSPSPSPAASQAASEFCGPAGATDDKQVTAQACVEHSGAASWGRVYVTNTSSGTQVVALNLTTTTGRVEETQCRVAAGAAHAVCETPQLTGAPATTATGAKATEDAIAEILAAGAPVSAGVLHVESGQVG